MVHFRFENNLAGANDVDIEGLADHFFKEFPEQRNFISHARTQRTPQKQQEVLRAFIQKLIERLLYLPPAAACIDTTLSDTKPTDSLEKARRQLKLINPKLIQTLAAKTGKSYDECEQMLLHKFQCSHNQETE